MALMVKAQVFGRIPSGSYSLNSLSSSQVDDEFPGRDHIGRHA